MNETPEKSEIQDKLNKLENQIRENQKITDHEIREYPIGVLVSKFTEGLETDQAELYIPDYQRELIWDTRKQSRFIESLFLNLPIPYLFVSDTNKDNDGRLEIVDGTQRIRTLVEFVSNAFQLSDLKKITEANGLTFNDLSQSRKLRFLRKTLRLIELTEYADEETRREIFDRLNSGGVNLNNMERRHGSSNSPIYPFIRSLITEHTNLINQLLPISEANQRRREYHELILRFFAYSDGYKNFGHSVTDFVEDYASNHTHADQDRLKSEFIAMLNFAKDNLPYGFKKTENARSTPRIRFEALSVGINLALRTNPNLQLTNTPDWLNSQHFITHTRSDASNSKPKVISRIEYVRNKLLGI